MDVVSGVSSAQSDTMEVDWTQRVAETAVPKSSVPIGKVPVSAWPVKAPPPGLESGYVLSAPSLLMRVAGEPIPKQPRRMTLESISEVPVVSTPEEPTEARAESNSVEPAPESRATMEVRYAVTVQRPQRP